MVFDALRLQVLLCEGYDSGLDVQSANCDLPVLRHQIFVDLVAMELSHLLELSELVLRLGQIEIRSNQEIIVVEIALARLVLCQECLCWNLDVDLVTSVVDCDHLFFD